MESLYLVVAGGGGSRGQQGTAWLLWPDVVVTALHVVGSPGGAGQWAHDTRKDEENTYRLRLPWRRPGEDVVAIEPRIHDARTDVALLRLPEAARADMPDDVFAVLADGVPGVGDPWRAVGFPGFVGGARALAVGGVVSHVGKSIANDTIQLFVDQDTSAQWGGISGSAVQNVWGEVTGVVLQTVERIATCNAAPAEAVASLLRLEARRPQIAAALASQLGALDPALLVDVANALEWGWLPGRTDFQAAPVTVLAERIAQAGEEGVRRALAALRTIAPPPAITSAVTVDPPDAAGVDPAVITPRALAALVAAAVVRRPTEEDLVAVLDALADVGGTIRPAIELRARLPGMPDGVLEAALDTLHTRGHLAGLRGAAAKIALSPEGARRAIRLDYARALLRSLLGAGAVPLGELDAKVGIAPRALRRVIAHAAAMGLVMTPDNRSYLITPAGAVLLAQRTVDPAGAQIDASNRPAPR